MKCMTVPEGQLSLYDVFPDFDRPIQYVPQAVQEPEVGEWVTTHGAVICHIMRPGYIGRRVVIDKSTIGHEWYQVGVLEKIVPSEYYRQDLNGKYVRVECDRSVVYTGSKQRQLIDHRPGVEIFECLPWEAYPERMAAIGARV